MIKLIDEQIKQEIFFEKYRYVSVKEYTDNMEKILNDTIAKIQKSKNHESRIFQLSLLKSIKEEISKVFKNTNVDLLIELNKVNTAFLASESSLLGVNFDSKLLDNIYDTKKDLYLGYTFSYTMGVSEKVAYNQIKKIITTNLAEGFNSDAFYKEVYNKQIALTASQIKTSVRTYSKEIRERIRDKTEKNIPGMSGFMSLATLDSVTSAKCISLDKMFYSIKKYKNRREIPDPVPRHFNCRSILVRITEKTMSYTRAANGDKKEQVDSRTTFNSFLKRNPKTALKLLGSERYNLFKTGRYNVNDFINNGEWLTIEELYENLT